MSPILAGFGAKRCFADLAINFGAQVRHSRIIGHNRVGRISGKQYFSYSQALGGTEQGADIVAAAQIVGNQDDAFHITNYNELVVANIMLMI